MHPFVPLGRTPAGAARRAVQALLLAASSLGRDEHPRLYRHVHPHDFGKYLIAESILLKPGPLAEAERAAVSLHPVYGAHLLSGLPAVTEAVRQVVLYHHEHWDGGGYPEGLAGRRIPLAARLVAVADVYTSLRARRSYKPPLT